MTSTDKTVSEPMASASESETTTSLAFTDPEEDRVSTVPSTIPSEKSSLPPATKKFKPSRAAPEAEVKYESLKTATSATSSPSVNTKQSVDASMNQVAQEANEIHHKWREAFKESEEFESIAVVRVETLLKEAYAHKQNLEAEKQALVGRLKGVTSILEKPPVPK